jgi:hypothetical protein
MHGIIQGDTIPSVATVKLFRLVIQGERPGVKLPIPNELQSAATPEPMALNEDHRSEADWREPLLAELDEVVPEDRDKVIDALRAVVRLAPKRRVRRAA